MTSHLPGRGLEAYPSRVERLVRGWPVGDATPAELAAARATLERNEHERMRGETPAR